MGIDKSKGEMHSGKVDTGKLAQTAAQNYASVAAFIKAKGKPNDHFPKDLDITFGEIRKALDGRVSGLGTILKNMKKEKLVDYRDPFVKDTTVVTLINDFDATLVSLGVTYEEITKKIDDKKTKKKFFLGFTKKKKKKKKKKS